MSDKTKRVLQAELDDALMWKKFWKDLAEDLMFSHVWATDNASDALLAHNKKISQMEKKVKKGKK